MLKITAFVAVLAALAGCTTPTQEGATCSAQWETYANDRMLGAILGGMLGASLSGNKPRCSFETPAVATRAR
jgi:hypothetical protein